MSYSIDKMIVWSDLLQEIHYYLDQACSHNIFVTAKIVILDVVVPPPPKKNKKQNNSKSKWNRIILLLARSGLPVLQTGIRFQTWWTAWHGVIAITMGPLSSAGSASGLPPWAGRLAMSSGGGAASAGYIWLGKIFSMIIYLPLVLGWYELLTVRWP